MDERNFRLHDGKKGAALAVRVVPRASKNQVVEVMNDGAVKIRLTSPADEVKLNKALIEFLADVLGVPSSRLDVVAGLRGNDKLISVLDLDAGVVQERILKHMS